MVDGNFGNLIKLVKKVENIDQTARAVDSEIQLVE